MASAYYSTVFEQPAPEVWKMIRDFNNYSIWVQGERQSEIEDGKSGDTVGAVKSAHFAAPISGCGCWPSRMSSSRRHEFCGAPALPVTDYQSTIRVTPVVDGERAFGSGRRRSTATRAAAAN